MRAALGVLVALACSAPTAPPPGLTLAELAGTWTVTEWRFVSTTDPSHVRVYVPGPAVVRVTVTIVDASTVALERWADDTVPLAPERWVRVAGDTVAVFVPGVGWMGTYVLAREGPTLTVQSAGGWPCFPFPTGCEPATETQVWTR